MTVSELIQKLQLFNGNLLVSMCFTVNKNESCYDVEDIDLCMGKTLDAEGHDAPCLIMDFGELEL